MRLAYSISGYKLPNQFRWLLEAIHDPRDAFAVHVDARTPEAVFREYVAAAAGRPNVLFIEREPIAYMGPGLVRSELRAIRALLAHAPEFDYLINLSAQDYPLEPRATITAELARTPGRNYVQAQPLRDQNWRARLRPHVLSIELGGRMIRTPILRVPSASLRIRWKGSWWHLLTRDFCRWLTTDPLPAAYLQYLKNVRASDELFFQNVVMNSPFADSRDHDNRHFIAWPRRSSSPAVLTSADWDRLVGSGMFYARKFDEAVDRAVLERLAERIGARAPERPVRPLAVAG